MVDSSSQNRAEVWVRMRGKKGPPPNELELLKEVPTRTLNRMRTIIANRIEMGVYQQLELSAAVAKGAALDDTVARQLAAVEGAMAALEGLDALLEIAINTKGQ